MEGLVDEPAASPSREADSAVDAARRGRSGYLGAQGGRRRVSRAHGKGDAAVRVLLRPLVRRSGHAIDGWACAVGRTGATAHCVIAAGGVPGTDVGASGRGQWPAVGQARGAVERG